MVDRPDSRDGADQPLPHQRGRFDRLIWLTVWEAGGLEWFWWRREFGCSEVMNVIRVSGVVWISEG